MRPRTVGELLLFLDLHACDGCGKADRSIFQLKTVGPHARAHRRIYEGTCPACGRRSRFEFEFPEDWQKWPQGRIGTDAPSTIITAKEFLKEAEADAARVPDRPENLSPEDYFTAFNRLRRARRCIQESRKLRKGPDRFDELGVLVDRYEALRERMTQARDAARPRLDGEPFSRKRYEEHQKWLDQGKGNRLILQFVDLSGQRMNELNLNEAMFLDTLCANTDFTQSRLASARFTHCSGKAVNLSKAGLKDAVFEECLIPSGDFRRSDMERCRITGGDWTRTRFGRAKLTSAEARDVCFHKARIDDAILDGSTFVNCDFRGARMIRKPTSMARMGTTRGTRFERCDFRGANFERRNLNGTVFDRCRFHGTKGKPEISGFLSVLKPDLSPDGDGSDIRDSGAVQALWGITPSRT